MLQASRVQCQRCPALCISRKSIVDGSGPTDALLMVVGDMPRREDDRSGNPFVGQDGQLLRSTIAEACVRLGVDGNRVYYTNSIRCRPAYQRPPTGEELANCMSWLVEEVEEIGPICILAVGAIAKEQVADVLCHTENYPYVLTVVEASHPAYILQHRDKLQNWTQQVEEAVRRAFQISPLPASGGNSVNVEAGSNWNFGQPDLSSPWLSADTEFDTLEEDGSIGQRMVGFSLSDGERSAFYAMPSVDEVPRSAWLRPYVEQPRNVVSTPFGMDADLRTDTNGARGVALMRQSALLQPDTLDCGDAEAERRGYESAWSGSRSGGDQQPQLEADSRTGADGSRQPDSISPGAIETLRLLSSRHNQSPIYVHNAKADLLNLGIDPDDLSAYEDTMLMAYVTRRFKRVGLKMLAPELAGIDWDGVSIKDLLREYTPSGLVFKSGPRKGQDKPGKWSPVVFSRALEARPDECRKYAATDAVATARIAMSLQPMLDDAGGWARNYYREFEKPLVPVLLSMEQSGVRVSPDALNEAGRVIDTARARTEMALRVVFGCVGLNGDEIKPILLDMGIVDGRLTPAGGIAVGVPDILRTFRVDKIEELPTEGVGQIARDLIEWRQMGKLRATYVNALLEKRDSADRIHARFNQAVANTNRLSSSDPNLQNIPNPEKSEIGKAIRRAFIPADGTVLVGGDFANLQLRIYGHITQEPVFLDTYSHSAKVARGCTEECKCDACDFHQNVATQMGRPRRQIKNFVFATMKGAEVAKAAKTAGVPEEQAAAFMDQLRVTIPSFLTFKVLISDTLMQQGYVESLMGWRMFYPDVLSSVRKWQSAAVREAADGLIQSTEAGLVKAFMIRVYQELRENFPAYRLVLQVHDELWAEGPPDQQEEVMAMMRRVAVEVGKLWIPTVPIRFETKAVMNWAEGK